MLALQSHASKQGSGSGHDKCHVSAHHADPSLQQVAGLYTWTTMTARDTVSFRMRSAYVLMLLTPTLASSAKKTKICTGAQVP